MPLAGTFDVLDFGEVLGLLSRRSATGRLQVRTVSMHGTIWLADGRATSAEIGSAAGGETRNKWRTLVEDICFDALRSPRGSFEFHPEDEASVPAGPRVRLETVVSAGKKRLEMWREVESVIHSFEAVPRLAESLSEDSVTLSQDKWRILVAIDGRRNVAALAKRLDIELLEFCQLLKPLIEGGAVILDQPEGWLKSLPKVRLEVAGREGDWPGGAPPAPTGDGTGAETGDRTGAAGDGRGGPGDGRAGSGDGRGDRRAMLTVGSSVLETNGHARVPLDGATPAGGGEDGSLMAGPVTVPSPGQLPSPGHQTADSRSRRRLRSRSRSRDARDAGDARAASDG